MRKLTYCICVSSVDLHDLVFVWCPGKFSSEVLAYVKTLCMQLSLYPSTHGLCCPRQFSAC